MKIAVMGAGAIGSLYGSLLAESGNEVAFIGREAHVKAIKQSGLTIKGFLDKRIWNIKAETTPANLYGENYDLILLAVKAYDAKKASTQIKPLIRSKAKVLCIQNGIGLEEEVGEILGKDKVLRGVTFCGATLSKPGVIIYTGFGDTVIGNPFTDGIDEVADVVDVFEKAGFSTKASKNIQSTVWTKTLVNAGINPYAALTEMRNGELLKNKGLSLLMAETVKEGVNVANKLGIPLECDPVTLMFKTIEATANNINSMLQDVMNGKRTEIDYINGAIWKLGEEVPTPTPLNSLLTSLVKCLEEKSGRRNFQCIFTHPKTS